MDGISSVGTTTSSYVPQVTSASSSPAPQPAASDTVTLSNGEDRATTSANTYAPDAGFTTLLQSDPGLALDYAADSQFGYDNAVLGNDDTLDTSTQAPVASTTPTQTSVAEKVDVSALDFSGGVMSALLGGGASNMSFFAGAGMSNLLTANGSAALAYLTPGAASASGSLNLSA